LVEANEVLEAIHKRRSIRAFKTKPLPSQAVSELKQAIKWAPSAGNLQSTFHYFVFDSATREQLARAAFDQDFVAQAPLAVVVCADFDAIKKYGQRGREVYAFLDCGIAIQNLLLAAFAQGLGSVVVGAFDEDRVRGILEIPERVRPVAIIPIGFPAESPQAPARKNVEKMTKDV
jgi:nitroreductase